MRKIKKLTAMGAICALTICQCIPSFAAYKTSATTGITTGSSVQPSTTDIPDTKFTKGSIRVNGETDVPYGVSTSQTYSYKTGASIHVVSPGKRLTFPGWYWVDQYCYYFTDFHNILKSTTTPDGYTVDENGRWTVDGVAQTNDYGNQVIGTDTLYAGKSQDEIEDLIIELSRDALANYNYTIDDMFSYNISDDSSISYQYKQAPESCFVDASHVILAGWSDGVLLNGTGAIGAEYLNERLIKIALGDHVGQEFFNDIRAAAEPLASNKFQMIRNADGGLTDTPLNQLVEVDGQSGNFYRYNSQVYEKCGDGVNEQLFDSSKWQNRTTDYGKSFKAKVVNNNSTGVIEIWFDFV